MIRQRMREPTSPPRPTLLRSARPASVSFHLSIWSAIACLVLTLASGCVDAPVPDPAADEFGAVGPSPVGYTTTTITFTNPLDQLERTLPLHVWYPATTSDGWLATYRTMGVFAIDSDVAVFDAPVEGDGLPLIVYSNGSGGDGVLAYEYGERLASFGYVVVAPSHIGNTVADRTFGGWRPLVEMLAQRPLDIQQTLDAIAASDVDALARARTDQVVLFGHSFGAYTTLAIAGMKIENANLEFLCSDGQDCSIRNDDRYFRLITSGFRDPRVVAIAPQAPAFTRAAVFASYADIDVPMILMSGREDVTTTHEEEATPTWERTVNNAVWYSFDHGGHQSFVTTCHDLAGWQQDLLLYRPAEDGCGASSTPAIDIIHTAVGAVRRLADATLRGESAAF